MGKWIVKQPNGKLAIFSTVVDDFLLYDATEDEIMEEFLGEARRQIQGWIDSAKDLDPLARGAFEDCIERIRDSRKAKRRRKALSKVADTP